MEKIDWVSAPDIDGMTWQETAKSLQQHSFEAAQRIMALTNELIDLKAEVQRLKQGC
jgi:hypothetical protein